MMAGGGALVHVKIALLLSRLWMFLFLFGWPRMVHSQYHSLPEVVIPLRVTATSRGMRPPGWVSYSMTFGGQRHIVHMKAKKLFLSRHLPVFTYSHQGALLEDQPFVQNDCYYDGYVEGDPDSLVALSTCFGGFRGRLEINDTAYEIMPRSFSVTFEHLVYKVDSEETQFSPMRCGLTDEEIEVQSNYGENAKSIQMQSHFWGFYPHRLFIELAFVVDNGRFLYKESNTSLVQMEILLAVHFIDRIYSAVQLHVIITGIEIWNEQNHIAIGNPDNMMRSFCSWTRNTRLKQRIPNDAAFIVMKQNTCINTTCTGRAWGLCLEAANCGLQCFVNETVHDFATGIAHTLGHISGLFHDGTYCACPRRVCLMNVRAQPADTLSNCSNAMLYQLSLRWGCLRVIGKPDEVITWKRCGNGVIELEEECDCGSTKSCAKDPCCSENCTLKPGARCAFGLCCEDCQFMPSGTLCREQMTECDLPEWCDGRSSECPEDVYVEDGLPCLGKGFCYEKRCNIRDDQCRRIFGRGAKNGNQACYLELNTKGDRFGNCGQQGQFYKRCNISDSICGRIHCQNVTQLPLLEDHSTAFMISTNGVLCWGTDYHFGMTIPDIGRVPDGTECGEGHMCVDAQCVPMPLWEEACLPEACNFRGICNNKHNCHCNDEWSPPDCKTEGTGGSSDSGPAPRRKKRVIHTTVRKKTTTNWTLPFVILSLLFLTILIILLIVNKKEQQKEQTAPKEKQKGQTLPVEGTANVPTAPGKTEKNTPKAPGTKEKKVPPAPEKQT